MTKVRASFPGCDFKSSRLAFSDDLKSQAGNDALTFVVNHDRVGSYQIRKLMKDNQEMIK